MTLPSISPHVQHGSSSFCQRENRLQQQQASMQKASSEASRKHKWNHGNFCDQQLSMQAISSTTARMTARLGARVRASSKCKSIEQASEATRKIAASSKVPCMIPHFPCVHQANASADQKAQTVHMAYPTGSSQQSQQQV